MRRTANFFAMEFQYMSAEDEAIRAGFEEQFSGGAAQSVER